MSRDEDFPLAGANAHCPRPARESAQFQNVLNALEEIENDFMDGSDQFECLSDFISDTWYKNYILVKIRDKSGIKAAIKYFNICVSEDEFTRGLKVATLRKKKDEIKCSELAGMSPNIDRSIEVKFFFNTLF